MPSRPRSHSALGVLAPFLVAAMLMPTDTRAQTDEQLIRAVDSTFNAAFLARDSVRLRSLYAANAVGMYPNTPIATGSAAILKSYAELWGMNGKLVGTPVSVTTSKSGDVATVMGKYQMSFTTLAGSVMDSGSYINVYRKGPTGKWEIVQELVTSHSPLVQPPVFDSDANMTMSGGASLKWDDLKVTGFDPGAKIAVVHGDPAGTGDYTVRLTFPDGYRFPVHWHPKAEHLTVLSGSFLLGMGTKVDNTALKTYGPGDFLYLPAKNTHFGGAKGVTVIQLHGLGPFTINLGTP
jgi:ketosteroid isomerase-like protein/quercetin dioxygenase-like cupin family protein